MSKFRRVEDTQNVPEYITERFAGVVDDPYKELRQGQQDRQMKIASQELGARSAKAQQINDWERNEAQAEYVHPSMMRELDEQLTRFSGADVNPNSVRRMDTGYDAGVNTRSANNQLFVTEEDAYHLISNGLSMWNSDFDEVSRICKSSMDEHDSHFSNTEQRRSARTEKNNQWQKKASRREMLGRHNVLERASAVVRNSFNNEFMSESSFGMPQYDSVIAQETERIRMMKEAREARMELQRKGYSPEERHASWEENAQRAVHANRYNDHKAAWIDNYVKKYDSDADNDIDLARG